MPRNLIPFLALASLCNGQPLQVKPEPRVRIAGNPEKIMQALLKDSEEVRLFAVNLDDDAELERVIVQRRDPDESATVYDFDGKSWWQVGEFSQWGMWEASDLVELQGKYLVVREQGHGTGVVRTELRIYRIRAGRLYPVFRTIEKDDYDTSGPGKKGEWHVERRNVIFAGQGDAIVVHRTEAVDPDPDAPCRPRSVACSAYRWDVEEFRFLRDLEADAAHCDKTTRQPRARTTTACGL